MENATENYYTIRHLTLITGLTDRTIRSYLAAGFLKGEKINGLWHFTPEQVEAFLRHGAVRPSIQARHHAAVYDFLIDENKATPAACLLMDLPGADEKETAEFFCYAISHGSYRNITFSFDSYAGVPRVILTGEMEEVWRLAEQYRSGK